MESDDDKTRTYVPLTNGTMVSHYRIIEKIGAGGVGEVCLAEDIKLNRQVALKFLPSHLCQDPDCRSRFTREAQAAAKLSHPGIVTIHEVGEFHGRPFIAMEHLEGQTLRELIKQKNIPLSKVINIAIQLCEGLQEAHAKGITHRDIKPSNIMCDGNGHCKILDFGLAAVQGSEPLTKTGSTLGTVGYMSPEQARGEKVDARSDLFSLGVVLYELIAGQSPFKAESEVATIKNIVEAIPEPLARYKAGLPYELQRIVSKALAKDKAVRYQHADEFAADLRGMVFGVGSIIDTRRRRLRISVLLAMVLGLTVVALILKPWQFAGRSGETSVVVENRLAVMYFDNLADPIDSSRLGEIATNLLITNLSESQYLQVVSSQRLYDILKLLGKEEGKRLDRSVATQVANKARAKTMLLGSVLQITPEIILTSQIIDVAAGNVRASQQITGTVGENIFPIIDRLSAEVKKDLSLPHAALNESIPLTADLTTHSPEAYRYYLEGFDFSNRSYTQEAEKSFLKALEFDSTFAMAYYRLSLLQLTKGNLEEGKKLISKAVEYSAKVSQKERLYIRMQEANISGKSAQAKDYLHQIIEHYPDEKEAYLALGALYYQDVRKYDEAIRYLTKTIEIDSGLSLPRSQALDALSYEHLAIVYDRIGDFEKSIWAIDRSISLASNEASPYDTKGYVFSRNGKIDQAIECYQKALEIKPNFYGSEAPPKLCRLYLFKRDYAKAESCYQALSSGNDKNTRSEGRTYLAYIPTYQGKLSQALMILDDGIAADRMEHAERWENADKYLLKALIHEETKNLNLALKEIAGC